MAKGNSMAELIPDLREGVWACGGFSLCPSAILHGGPSLPLGDIIGWSVQKVDFEMEIGIQEVS